MPIVRSKSGAPVRGASHIILAVLSAAAVTACRSAPPAAVTVTTQSFRYEPAAFEWQRGQPVHLTLRNPDAVEHDFVVDGLRVRVTSGAGGHAHSAASTPAAGTAGAASGAGTTGSAAATPAPDALHVHADAFSQNVLLFTPLNAGTFTVYCTVPGHKEAGMTARLVVK